MLPATLANLIGVLLISVGGVLGGMLHHALFPIITH